MKRLIFFLIYATHVQAHAVDPKECLITLTGKPYCMTRANAAQTCQQLVKSDDDFQTIKKCLVNAANLFGSMNSKAYSLCLVVDAKTGDKNQDTSNCFEAAKDHDSTTTGK